MDREGRETQKNRREKRKRHNRKRPTIIKRSRDRPTNPKGRGGGRREEERTNKRNEATTEEIGDLLIHSLMLLLYV